MARQENVKRGKSSFYRFMESVSQRKTFFWEGPHANNGDRLILMSVQRILRETGCTLVDTPELAEQILMNGGGRFQDVWPSAFDDIIYYRREYPSLPLIMAPQVFRVRNINFKEICEISRSPITLFAREHISAESLREANLPVHCEVRLSQDPAFELEDSEFISKLVKESSEKHVLVAMRKDDQGCARLLVRTRGTWLPKKIRRPLSWVRDRMVAHISMDITTRILKQENLSRKLPKVYRDISSSVTFEEFVAFIRDAALIITNRLHVAIFGHLLGKRVVIVCEPEYVGQKLKGVYEFSMQGPESRTRLYQ